MAGQAAHLSCRLKDLLSAAPTSVHGVVHHASFVELAVCLPVEWVVLIALAVNPLRPARPLKVLTLCTITVARSLICDNTPTNHSESAAVLTLPRNLLELLVLDAALSVGEVDYAASTFHWAHGELGEVVRVAGHRRVDVVARASALVKCHMDLLIVLFAAIIASTPFLHIRRCIPRYVCVVRESAPELGLVTIALSTSCVLTLLIGLALAVRLLIIQYLNILIIIIIIWFLALRLESTHRHARQRTILSLIYSRARTWRSVDVVIGIGALSTSQISRWTQSW